MRPIPLVNASVLDPLFQHLERSGEPEVAELVRVGASLPGPATLLPLATAGRLWQSAACLLGRRDLGLAIGSATRPQDVGSVGALVRSAPDLATALEWAIEQAPRWSSGEGYWLRRERGDVILHHTFSRTLREGRALGNDFVLALWIQLIRVAAGERWRPIEIGLPGPRPDHAAELEGLAERGVRFGEDSLAIRLPRELLAVRLPEAPSGGPGCGARTDADFVGSLRQAITALLQLGSADVGSLASSAGMSVRSLQRRMAEHHVSFTDLLEGCRADAARRLLRDPRQKVITVATELGYADPANFSRAFRRWTGSSPREFRMAADEATS